MLFIDTVSEKKTMPRVSRKIVETRPEEIVNACRKLYKTMSFHEVTISRISEETSISRPSIYNYFQTKEEIFLALLKDEFDRWTTSLEKLLENSSMRKKELTDRIGESLEERKLMLRIQCMNLYDIEENSREERLIDFKMSYGKSIEALRACIGKFIPAMTDDDITGFIYDFYPFMYGLYPYAHPTEKQSSAMAKVGIAPSGLSIKELAGRCICDLLAEYKEE